MNLWILVLPVKTVTLTDTVGPQLPEACWLMTWHHDHTRSCQATGNDNPGTSFSAIAKKLESIYGHSVNCRACCFKLKHFEKFFGTPLHVCDTLWRENHDAILKLASYIIPNCGQCLFTNRDLRGPLPGLPLIVNQSKTNAQCLHHKVFVETDHTDHNIRSFDASDDRQHQSGWMSANHNTTCLTFLHWYLTKLFLPLRWCLALFWSAGDPGSFRRCPNFHFKESKLGASQSFSRKLNSRYLLKVPIIIYYHSTPITTLLA